MSLVILPCPTCGRAVQVFGRVRRVLCACGEILMEIDGRASSSPRSSAEGDMTLEMQDGAPIA